MDLIDLHVHSTASDGTFTPREVAFYAKAKRLQAIALTDHDTVSGVKDCMEAGRLVGLEVIPGIELSAQYKDKEVHILGYFIDINDAPFLQELERLTKVRIARNEQMLQRFNERGIDLKFEDLLQDGAKDAVLTRAHFAKALLNKGYVHSMNEAFDRYLGDGKPCYVQREYPSYIDCIRMIHKAGGIAVIAHPMLYRLPHSHYPSFIEDLAKAGLNGIETIYPKHSYPDTQMLFEFCHALGLLPTGGSDFHGSNKKEIEIGTGLGQTQVSYDVLSSLKKRKR
jgi:hypothetical protein